VIIVDVIIGLWVLWVVAHLFAMLVVTPDSPSITGNRIWIPPELKFKLTETEIAAVYLHECGHRNRGHIWKNFLQVCFFMRPSAEVRRQQEFEADDFAASRGYGKPLASALRKLSIDPFDQQRADRLDPQ